MRDYFRLREKKEAGQRDIVYNPGLAPGPGFSFDFSSFFSYLIKKNPTHGLLLEQLPNLNEIYRLDHIKYYFPDFDHFALVM